MDEELPSGWIKETRIKMLDNKVVRRNSVSKNSYDPGGIYLGGFKHQSDIFVPYTTVTTNSILLHGNLSKTTL